MEPNDRQSAGETHAPWIRCDTGAIWLDLVATVGKAYGPAPIDRLDSPKRLREWLDAESLGPEAEPTQADLVYARELREALRGLGLATARSTARRAEDVRLVNDALANDRTLILSEGRGGQLVVGRPETCRDALARIARQAAEQLTGPTAAHLGTCADARCSMLFLDPGGRRKWCAAEVCGVRHRVRAHRQRRETTR